MQGKQLKQLDAEFWRAATDREGGFRGAQCHVPAATSAVRLPGIESADIGEAMKAIEAEQNNLKGVLPKNYAIFSPGHTSTSSTNLRCSGRGKAANFFTPMSLVEIFVNIIESDHGVVFDPACFRQPNTNAA